MELSAGKGCPVESILFIGKVLSTVLTNGLTIPFVFVNLISG